MEKVINIGNKEKAIKMLSQYKGKLYVPADIRFTNVDLTILKDKNNKQIFTKKDLFVNSTTLYEIMLPVGFKGRHNSHGLMPEEVWYALHTIKDSKEITTSDNNVYVIITLCIAECNDVIIAIIEKDAGLISKSNVKINKLITMYPKRGRKIPNNAKKIIDIKK